jgi:hypothetical protein
MAIPKKGSRTITVEGVRYRWRIRSQPTYDEGAFASNFSIAVERAEQPSRCVLLLAADFPRPDNWLGHPAKTITPRMIAASIKDALAQGWQPEQTGSVFTHPLHAASMP